MQQQNPQETYDCNHKKDLFSQKYNLKFNLNIQLYYFNNITSFSLDNILVAIYTSNVTVLPKSMS